MPGTSVAHLKRNILELIQIPASQLFLFSTVTPGTNTYYKVFHKPASFMHNIVLQQTRYICFLVPVYLLCVGCARHFHCTYFTKLLNFTHLQKFLNNSHFCDSLTAIRDYYVISLINYPDIIYTVVFWWVFCRKQRYAARTYCSDLIFGMIYFVMKQA